jgi:hypothetical protein
MISLNFHDVQDGTILTVDSIPENGTIFIHLDCESEDKSWGIYLDKSTAIKFSKELRKQIAQIH